MSGWDDVTCLQLSFGGVNAALPATAAKFVKYNKYYTVIIRHMGASEPTKMFYGVQIV